MDERNTKVILGKRPWKWKRRDRYLVINMRMAMESKVVKQVQDNS